MKKLLLFIIEITVLNGMIGGLRAQTVQFTQVSPSGHSIKYQINDSTRTVSIIQGNYFQYPGGELVIPDSVDYEGERFPVVKLENQAFSQCSAITSAIVPQTVKAIGERAFNGCTKLRSITLSESIEKIEDYTFRACTRLTNIVIPSNVKVIGNCVFMSCDSLREIVIPEKVEEIGYSAFAGCYNISSIVIPDSVKTMKQTTFKECKSLQSIVIGAGIDSIYADIFSGCDNLSRIIISPNNETFDSRDECNAIIRRRDNTLILGCQGTVVPRSVEKIGDKAFTNCKYIDTIEIPPAVREIGNSAFEGCTGLKEIKIWEGVTQIGDLAFNKCSSLEHIELPSSVTTTGAYVLSHCTQLKEVRLSSTMTKINEGTLYMCRQLETITLPQSLIRIGDWAFYCCDKLREIVIPDRVTSVGNKAFQQCTELKKITVGRSVRTIGNESFSKCESVDTIITRATGVPTIPDTNTFKNVPEECLLIVPCSTAVAYSVWPFTNIEEDCHMGINGTEMEDIHVYTRGEGEIVIGGAPNQRVIVYDVMGRKIAERRTMEGEIPIRVPSVGVYFVQVGRGKAQRIVVTR